ncbi:MAG TPA: hypothetical protein DHW63_05040, partial [Hyphomonadaceae bacterium]|nr:hypothetical protein [Hyphomonadaceae bacterium]
MLAGARELSMNEISSDFAGMAPETLARAAEAAERAGLSVSDYLALVLLGGAQEPAAEENPREDYTLRHRIEAMERRFGLSVGGLDHALQALDSALFGLAARLDQSELSGQDAAETVNALQVEFGGLAGEVGGLTDRLGRVEEHAAALHSAADAAKTSIGVLRARHDEAAATFEAKHDLLALRLDSVKDIAVRADQASDLLSETQDALRGAVEHDLRVLAEDVSSKVDGSLAALRGEAAAAAAQAEAALATGLADIRQEVAAQAERTDAAFATGLIAVREEGLAAARQADAAL